MKITYITTDQKIVTEQVTQVIIKNDVDMPVALAVLHGGFVVYTDITKPDFKLWCRFCGLKAPDTVEVL